MARPTKWRSVCGLPESNRYGPLDGEIDEDHSIIMSIDQYETIRLIDLEGLTQEECAQQMNVARTTVQRIYSDARKILAISLIECKILRIEGGDYKLCDGIHPGRCGRRGELGGQFIGQGRGLGRGRNRKETINPE